MVKIDPIYSKLRQYNAGIEFFLESQVSQLFTKKKKKKKHLAAAAILVESVVESHAFSEANISLRPV